MALTEAVCNSAKTKEKPYKLADSGGLYLFVKPSGSKLWRVKYRFQGKENALALGAYPGISLKQARLERDEAKESLKNGIDPAKVRRAVKEKGAKYVQAKSAFNLSLSLSGVLTIETATHLVHLSPAQTEAIRAFLIASPVLMESKCHETH